MKNNNDVDDGVFDWNLLNGGKGWEAAINKSYPKCKTRA
ncbi:hypothetical protein MPER_16092 [Moniliophthora perniciosa FA553]|nr:hypothetical protein MPER_16092 [Moniliophthora perniciosa FA553]